MRKGKKMGITKNRFGFQGKLLEDRSKYIFNLSHSGPKKRLADCEGC